MEKNENLQMAFRCESIRGNKSNAKRGLAALRFQPIVQSAYEQAGLLAYITDHNVLEFVKRQTNRVTFLDLIKKFCTPIKSREKKMEAVMRLKMVLANSIINLGTIGHHHRFFYPSCYGQHMKTVFKKHYKTTKANRAKEMKRQHSVRFRKPYKHIRWYDRLNKQTT